jgi:putative heme iron utilization protein
MVEGWIKIYSANEEYKAEVIKSLLENNGLHPVLLDRKDDEFRIGFAEVYVAPEEAEQAKDIIDNNKKKNKGQSPKH